MLQNQTPIHIILQSIIFSGPKKVKTLTQAARHLHITRPALSKVLNGHAELSIPLADKIEYIFQYSALDLLNRQTLIKLTKHRAQNYWQAPKFLTKNPDDD